MLTITQLVQYLRDNQADFKIIKHTDPIFTVKDAEKYFDIDKAAPVYILQTEKGFSLKRDTRQVQSPSSVTGYRLG